MNNPYIDNIKKRKSVAGWHTIEDIWIVHEQITPTNENTNPYDKTGKGKSVARWETIEDTWNGSFDKSALLTLLKKDNKYYTIKDNTLIEVPYTIQSFTNDYIDFSGVDNIENLINGYQLVSIADNDSPEVTIKGKKDLTKFIECDNLVLVVSNGSLPTVKIIGYNAPQLMLPNSDIRFNKLKSINDINIKAKDVSNKVRVVFSVNSGENWYSKKLFEGEYQDTEVDINDLNDISINGMTIDEFNSIKENWSEQLIASHKVRFAYLLDLDDSSTISEVDEIKANISMFGGWKLLKKGKDYNYGYTNTQLMVTLSKNGTYKVNYIGD